jgi:hypothetical protein
MVWLNALMGGLFVLSAGLQLNDPDPAVWVIAYLLGGAACVAWHQAWLTRWRAWALSLGYGAAAVWVWWGVPDGAEVASALSHWKMVGLGAEPIREGVGLGLVAVWMNVLGWCHSNHAGTLGSETDLHT